MRKILSVCALMGALLLSGCTVTLGDPTKPGANKPKPSTGGGSIFTPPKPTPKPKPIPKPAPKPKSSFDLICVKNDTRYSVKLYYWTSTWRTKDIAPNGYATLAWNRTSSTGQTLQVRLNKGLKTRQAFQSYTLRSIVSSSSTCNNSLTRYVIAQLPNQGIGLFTKK